MSDLVLVNVYMTKEERERIDRVAKYLGASRSNFIRTDAVQKAARIEKALGLPWCNPAIAEHVFYDFDGTVQYPNEIPCLCGKTTGSPPE